jgi:hypothetical protein
LERRVRVIDRSKTYAALKALFAPYASRLTVTSDDGTTYMLDGAYSPVMKRAMFFGGVRYGKNYVSVHLMPVYTNPELLSPISDALRKRMQGKSCFNFTAPEADLFADLALLINAGFKKYEAQGHIAP